MTPRPPARRDIVTATEILRALLTALPSSATVGREREAYLRGACEAWAIAAPAPPAAAPPNPPTKETK